MATIFILRGLPKSGKTTMANELLKKHPNSIRLNKHDLGPLLFRHRRNTPKTQKLLNELYFGLAENALKINMNVIDDNCNLDRISIRWYERFVKANKQHRVKIVNVATPLDICLKRNAKSKLPLSKDSIVDMAFRYKVAKQDKRWILVGIDDILYDYRKREGMAKLNGSILDQDVLYDPKNLEKDVVLQSGVDLIKKHVNDEYDIIFYSFRPERARKITESQLINAELFWSRLIMQPNNATKPKLATIRNDISTLVDVSKCIYCIEKNPTIINFLNSLKLEVKNG